MLLFNVLNHYFPLDSYKIPSKLDTDQASHFLNTYALETLIQVLVCSPGMVDSSTHPLINYFAHQPKLCIWVMARRKHMMNLPKFINHTSPGPACKRDAHAFQFPLFSLLAAQLLSVAQPPPDSPDSPTNTQPELVLLKMLPQVSISVIPGHSGHSSSLQLTHATFGRIKIH